MRSADVFWVVTPSARVGSGSRGSTCAIRFCTCTCALSMSAPTRKVTVMSTAPFAVDCELM